MKIESNQNENTAVPVAFIDEEGDLWFRTTRETDVMKNKVSIISTDQETPLDNYSMNDFMACLGNHEQSCCVNYAVVKFYEGGSFTLTA